MAEAPVQRTQQAISNNNLQSPDTPSVDKKSLRQEITLRRDSISSELKTKKDIAVWERLATLQIFKEARTILFYASFRSEVNTEKLIRDSLSSSRITALPRVDKVNETLKLYEIRDWSDLAPGSWGILEPAASKEREISIDAVDIVLAPGLAFDRYCNRLGYGKGYYDKLLGARKGLKPYIIALAYEEQIADSVPYNLHDIKMDLIITDKRTIICHEP